MKRNPHTDEIHRLINELEEETKKCIQDTHPHLDVYFEEFLATNKGGSELIERLDRAIRGVLASKRL